MQTVFESAVKEKSNDENNLKTSTPIQRLTAFWAFSEAALGGVLHITRLPFKGILIAGAATLFVTLIGQFSKNKGTILKSTVLVIVVKYIVSPYTPITAAVAVLAQGLLGEFFFMSQRFKKIRILTFSMLIQFITAVQKILIVTILFGQNFWTTVDNFANSVLNEIITTGKLEFSFLIIIAYTMIHVIAGLFIGIFILQLLNHLRDSKRSNLLQITNFENAESIIKRSGKRKHWFQKPSGIAILIFLLTSLGISFFLPEWMKSDVSDIIFMIVRAIIIIILWYFLVSPLLLKILSKIISKHKIKHLDELDDILQFFPLLKQVVAMSWKDSKRYSGITRIKVFTFQIILYTVVK